MDSRMFAFVRAVLLVALIKEAVSFAPSGGLSWWSRLPLSVRGTKSRMAISQHSSNTVKMMLASTEQAASPPFSMPKWIPPEKNEDLQKLPFLRVQEEYEEGTTLRFDYPAIIPTPPCEPEDATKPLLLFLPGIDGVGWFAEDQYEDLSRHFEIRTLQVSCQDRSDFNTLVSTVVGFIKDWQRRSGYRHGKTVLMGESFGGTLALGVALEAQELLQGLLLSNPASAVSETEGPDIGRRLAAVPEATPMGAERLPELVQRLDKLKLADGLPMADYTLGELAYAAYVGVLLLQKVFDETQIQQYTELAKGRLAELQAAWAEGRGREEVEALLEDGVTALDGLMSVLPPGALEHRLGRCLLAGEGAVEGRLGEVEVRVVVLGGKRDALLPSAEETLRLSEALPNCQRVVALRSGHLALDGRVNVTHIILHSQVAPPSVALDPVFDWEAPSEEFCEEVYEGVQGIRSWLSPVFVSTDGAGRSVRGLEGLPAQEAGRPLLFVGNHQTLSLDLAMLIGEVKRQKGYLLRGLAHPGLFDGFTQGEPMSGLPGVPEGVLDPMSNVFRTFGAVPVTPRNTLKLMQRGDAVLLFPGGLLETIPTRGDPYELQWPEEHEFVKMAAKYNAIIVPFGGVGGGETAQVVASIEQADWLKQSPLAPLLPDWFKIVGTRQGGTMLDQTYGGPLDAERLAFPKVPLALPNWPWKQPRMYFKFGAPICASSLDVSSPEASQESYLRVKREVEDCIGYLKAKRTEDPFALWQIRKEWEEANGRQAPTFEP